jgi:stage V sporulation protein K
LKKRNPISFLEDSFYFLKEYIEDEFQSSEKVIDNTLLIELKKETTAILSFCEMLNQDSEFIQKANQICSQNNPNNLQFKAEQLFLSDIINIYNHQQNFESEKALFVLAYYFDVLNNQHFADEKAINTLNKVIKNSDFKSHIQRIRNEHKITTNGHQSNKSWLLTVVTQIKSVNTKQLLYHFEKFALFAFNSVFEKEALSKIETQSVKNSKVNEIHQEDSLEKVLQELNQLIGLEKVKNDVKELINLLEVQKKREAQGLKNVEIMLHTVFLGPPGTGKTSVARLLSRIYKHLGFLSKGQLYETDREGMIAGFVGQTATKVDQVIQESVGGVLFIDEAYALTQNNLGNDYGAEAINTLIKRMEDYRNDLSVVVAGYTEPMKLFIESNPGLRSRFNRYFYFDHFTPEQLLQIFESFCNNSDFILEENAKEKVEATFELLYDKKEDSFGNARFVRNMFEKCIQNQANRIVKASKISKKALKTILEQDIPEPNETLKQLSFTTS